jgi:ubiquinone/menaquinone biosynthesis C-methylase UbiE
MDRLTADKISKKVQDDYNRIAKVFSNKRRYLTQDIVDLGEYISRDDLILDLGCGNGRLSELVRDRGGKYIGIDNSQGMIEQAKFLYPCEDFRFFNGETIEFSDRHFDKIFCLAVIHHIPSTEKRSAFINEIKRVAKNGAQIVLTVWDLTKEIESFKKLPEGSGNDILYEFKDGSSKILAQRYVHVFSKDELESLIKKSGLKLINIFQNSRGKKKINHNLVVIAQKI